MARDDIGRRGEAIAHLVITEPCGRLEPFFRPWFLDSKFPTFDYIVYLVDHPTFFFFVQVKTTIQGYTKGSPARLLVQVSRKDIELMVRCPAPCYLLGIDLEGIRGYWLSANEPRKRVASLTTAFPADCAHLAKLHNEVRDFWLGRDMMLRGSHFRE